jgi:hypothetical protein
LKNLGKKYNKMWEAFRVRQSQVKGLTWNELHGDLKNIGLHVKKIANIIDGQILVTFRGWLASKMLIGLCNVPCNECCSNEVNTYFELCE